jgi:tetratricopeptide (TPR) repeat protein
LLAAYRSNPKDWKLAHQTALAYTERNQFNEAATYFRKALAGNPGFVPARKNLAVVLWFAGKHAESEVLFRQLVPDLPNDPVPHLYLGLALHGRAQYAEAHRQFASAGELATANPDVVPEVLESYLAAGDRSVLENATRLVAIARSPELSLRTAAVLDKYGCAEQAYSVYRSALEFAPSNEPLYLALASFASAHENNGYGLQILDRGLQLLPGSAALYFHRGLLSALDGKRDQALTDLTKAAAANRQWPLPVLAKGVLQLEAGQSAESADTFASVLRERPDDPSAAYLRALALNRTGDPETRAEQIRLLESAVRTKPDNARALTLLGRIYADSGRQKEAIECLRKAVRSDGRNATAEYQLSLALRRAGLTAEADKHLVRFRQLRDVKEESELVQFLRVRP